MPSTTTIVLSSVVVQEYNSEAGFRAHTLDLLTLLYPLNQAEQQQRTFYHCVSDCPTVSTSERRHMNQGLK